MIVAGVAALLLAAGVASVAYLRLAISIRTLAGALLDEPPASRSWWRVGPDVLAIGRTLRDGSEARSRALAEAERRRELIEFSLGPILSVDGTGRIIDLNQAAEAVFSVSRQRVTGLPVAELIDAASLLAAQRQGFRAFLAADNDARSRHRITARGRRGDGRSFPVELAVAVLPEPEGPVYCASIRDLTDRFEADAAKLESATKSSFLAGMSHEVRTPLNSILGFAQLLAAEAAGPLTARQRRYVENIRTSGDHLLALINDVLDIAKVQSGRLTLAFDTLDLRSVLLEVCEEAYPSASRNGIAIDLEPLAEPLQVHADRTRLRQVLTNVVGNAIKFTEPGGLVRIRCSETGNGEFVAIAVEDTGQGIAADALDLVFEEYVQLAGAGGVVSGTGLGLPLSRRLVEAMGGHLEVSSREGFGSTFTVSIPTRPVRSLQSQQAG